MKNFVSVKTKLTVSTMAIISVIFITVLSVIMYINIRTVSRSIHKSEHNIRNALIAKGKTLINNNSIAMSGMAGDNAFTAIQNLVLSTVKEDSDIIYGIYMDTLYLPWAYTSAENPERESHSVRPLEDEMAKWAGALTQSDYKTYRYKNDEVIEFAAPVIFEDEIYGFIRYGISTQSMRESLEDARSDGIRTQRQIIGMLAFIGMLSLFVSYLIVRRLADRITHPVAALVQSTKTIARGNYDVPVTSDSNDELGLLVNDVDTMRIAIKNLTQNLKEQERLKKEMELARKIQTSLLPTLTDNMHPDFQIAAAMVPADQVGGDFYDISFDRSGGLWLAVGDVSGHGVTPGLIMMMAQTVHATVTATLDCDARSVVVKVNEILYKNVHDRLNESHFMTFTALKYMGDGRFQHAGAHLSIIVFRHQTETCELIRTKGVYLNFKKDISRATKNSEFFLEPGDTLILYTDGLTEAENLDGKMLDIEGFMRIVEKHIQGDPEEMKEMIMADVIQWCDNRRADDMTLVIVRRKADS
jgi:serine phosphatase RsbU (regulator of sigma subunit)